MSNQAPDQAQPITRRSLWHWVWRSDKRLQLILLTCILLTVVARVLPLEMQKRIVNQAVSQRRQDLLLQYCALYLGAVVFAGLLKYCINYLQTRLGERCLAELRKDLYHHILTLPVGFFRGTPSGAVVNALTNELSTVGDLVGMAMAVPVTNLLTLGAFAVYLLWLNPLLAGLSLAIYPLALLVLPWLQGQVNRANSQRVDGTRSFSSKIGEAVTGIHEIHANGSYHLEYQKYDSLVERLYAIRMRWNLLRAGAKSLNNFFVSLGPWCILGVGGYLVITGRLDLGALVAFLSAQEKLYDPWKELLEFYQLAEDATVRYRRTMSYFDTQAESALEPLNRPPLVLEPSVDIAGLSYAVGDGLRLLSDVTVGLQPGERLALIGFSGSGKSTLAMCVAQLYRYTSGRLTLGGQDVHGLTKRDMAENVGFVSQTPFIFDGSIRENLLYAHEALGNREDPSLDDQIEMLQQTGLFPDVLRFGLAAMLDPLRQPELAAGLVGIRARFQEEFGQELAEQVEFFDPSRYLYHSTVLANLCFGAQAAHGRAASRGADFRDSPLLRGFLDATGLTTPLLELGAALAEATIDILGDLPAEGIFFEDSPLQPEAMDQYRDVLVRIKRRSLAQLPVADTAALLRLALDFIPGRHRMLALPAGLRDRVLAARSLFRQAAERDMPGSFAFYQPDTYLGALSILDNILFGRVKTSAAGVQETIGQAITQLLIEAELLEAIVGLGMEYQVGTKGDRLSGGQRQKLAIARVLLKQPRLLILDEATSALDNRSQSRIQNLLDTTLRGRCTVIAVAHRLDTIRTFDKIAVMKSGKIAELGSYDELMAKGGIFHELVSGKRPG